MELRRAFDLISKVKLDECCKEFGFPKEEERIFSFCAPQAKVTVAPSISVPHHRNGRGGGRGGRQHYQHRGGIIPGLCRNTAAQEDCLKLTLRRLAWKTFPEVRMVGAGKPGSIILVASMPGSIVNYPQEQSCYNASKAGVIPFGKSVIAACGVLSDAKVATSDQTKSGFKQNNVPETCIANLFEAVRPRAQVCGPGGWQNIARGNWESGIRITRSAQCFCPVNCLRTCDRWRKASMLRSRVVILERPKAKAGILGHRQKVPKGRKKGRQQGDQRNGASLRRRGPR